MSRAGSERHPCPVRHGLFSVAVCLAVLGILAVAVQAGVPSPGSLRTEDPDIRARFGDAIAKFQDGKFEEAEVIFRQLDVRTGLSAHDREILSLMVGKCLYAEKAYLDCKRHLERFLTRHPDSEHESAARVIVGHCYFHLRDYERAASSYAAAMATGPKSHREIAEANLEPLVKNALRLHDLEFLLLGLEDIEAHHRVRLWIANRWYDAGWRQEATDLYRQLASVARRSDAGRKALERLSEIEDIKTRILTVAVMGPLSGDFAAYGRQIERAALLASEQLGERIHLVRGDTWGDSTRAAFLADSLAKAGCQAVIGPLVPAAINAAAVVFARADIVQILPLARRGDFTQASPSLYQMARSPADQAATLAEYATRSMKLSHFGILCSDTPEGRAAAAAFAQTATSAGARVYPEAFFEPGDTDFGPQLRELKTRCADPASKRDDEGKRLKLSDWVPILDGMLIWGDPEDFVLIVPQVVFHRFRVQYFGPTGWGETEALQRIQTALDSVTFASHEWVDTTRAEWKELAREFRQRWQVRPSNLAVRVYDLAQWLGQASTNVRDHRGLARFLTRPEGYQGISGTWRFGEDRLPEQTPIYHYRHGVPLRADTD
jgi:ABC-type branched-subunit amino acid transport system substrate-binding protein